MTPGSTSDPVIVNVLPEPVAPYAKTHAFLPRSSTPGSSAIAVFSNASSWPTSGANAWSKQYDLSFALLIRR